MSRPSLAGCKVLELGVYIAGPFAGRLLAQLGAEVIKIEGRRGDPARTETPGLFVANNLGKKSVCLDLRSEAGRAVFDRMLAASDVVLINLAPDAAKHLRVTYEDCIATNPKIVYCHVKGYGPGPLEDEVATNPIAEASSGVMFKNRVDGRPVRHGLSYYDMAASTFAVIGVLAALASNDDHANDRHIEVGLYETGLYLSGGSIVTEELQAPRTSTASHAVNAAEPFTGRPGYGAYLTADERWIYLLMLTDGQWRDFCEIMRLREATDTSLETTRQRQQRHEYVEDLVAKTVAALSFDEISKRLRAGGFGFTEVRPFATVLEHEQAREPEKVLTVSSDGRQLKVPNVPISGGSILSTSTVGPPSLGQHSIEVLDELGYDAAERSELIAQGVVADGDQHLLRPTSPAASR